MEAASKTGSIQIGDDVRSVWDSRRRRSWRCSPSRSARNVARKREDFAMLDFAYGLLMRSDVMIPACISVAAAIWFGLSKLGVMKPAGPFDARNMRTWPLSFAVIDAALFGVIFAAVSAALGEGEFSVAIAGGAAAFLTFGPAPAILAKIRK